MTLHKAGRLPKPLQVSCWRAWQRQLCLPAPLQLTCPAPAAVAQGLSGPLLEDEGSWVVQGFSFPDYLRQLGQVGQPGGPAGGGLRRY